jgi:hypothetical protein
MDSDVYKNLRSKWEDFLRLFYSDEESVHGGDSGGQGNNGGNSEDDGQQTADAGSSSRTSRKMHHSPDSESTARKHKEETLKQGRRHLMALKTFDASLHKFRNEKVRYKFFVYLVINSALTVRTLHWKKPGLFRVERKSAVAEVRRLQSRQAGL